MSTNRWRDKEVVWHIYTMEYYSAIKRNTCESVPMRWMNLEPIIQSEVREVTQSCPTLCAPMGCSLPSSSLHGTLQARVLEWVAISFSNEWKWEVKVKLLSRVWPSATPWTAAFQAPPSMGLSRQEYWSGVPLPSPNRKPESSRKGHRTGRAT